MKKFPNTPNYTGLNTPLGIEWQAFDLDIEGVIPKEVEGSFFRAVPDPAYPPFDDAEPVLADDGMVQRIQFKDGHAHCAIRYVQTERYKAERKANERLFGSYRNPYTDKDSVKGVDRTTANTTPIWHGGRLLMAKEDGRPYEVDVDTLETLGSWDYNGKLKSQTMTAHPRIDATTGEMFFFGYEADGMSSKTISYCIADRDGNLTSEQFIDTPYCSLMHDFLITEKYAIFPLFPTTSNEERVKAGGAHWVHEPELESWIGFMPRYGKASEMQWIKGPKGISSFHYMNAFDDENGLIHMDLCMYDTNFFDFIRKASGINCEMHEIDSSLTRWTIDPKNPDKGIDERVLGPGGDMPRIREIDQGKPYNIAWYLNFNPEFGPPLVGGPLGATVNQLMRINIETGDVDYLLLPPETAINEPIHIASEQADHGGWILAVIDKKIADDDYRSEVWVLDADNITAEPVAKVKIPARVRPQVHGWWVSK
jgi:carotenoid cleavage dioxygenase-like enzyme